MYKELDNLLSARTSIDSWYDEGFIIAQNIMNDFLERDWEELSSNVLNKNLEWQKKLVYCIDNQLIEEELEIITKLLNTEDDELLEMCIDSLRSFDNELGYSYIKAHPEIVEKAKYKLREVENVSTVMIKSFLKIFGSN